MTSHPQIDGAFPGERGARLPLLTALALAALPQATTVNFAILALFLISLAARFHGGSVARLLASLVSCAIIFIVGAGWIYISYRTLLGLQAGLSLLMLLLSLKVLEARSARDFSVMVSLGCFLCASNLFISQSLLSMLYQLAIIALLLAALVRLHSRGEPGGFSYKISLRLITLGLPMAVLIFLLVPRQGAAFRINLSGKDVNLSGMSDSLSAGSFADVVLSTEVAFRATFPTEPVPDTLHLYWRANVLYECNGFDWSRGTEIPPTKSPEPTQTSRDLRQRITIEPHANRWMPALDRPVSRERNADLMPDQVLFSRVPLYLSTSYEVVSRVGGSEQGLSPLWKARLCQLPQDTDPRVKFLAASLTGRDASDTIKRVLRLFRTGGFRYSLSPGTYNKKNGVAEFLFERKVGFCEHYAAACALLLRAAGVPARVVIGYQGGELNKVGNYVIVRQSDAHAWCEAYVDDTGWIRIDPTTIVAPDRISSGLEAFLDLEPGAQEGLAGLVGRSGLNHLLRGVRLFWDNLDYQWTAGVVSFDELAQSTLLSTAGVAAAAHRFVLWSILAAGLAMCLWALRAWKWPSGPPADLPKRAFERLRRTVHRRGLRSAPSEGPIHFLERAAKEFPVASQQLAAFRDWYAATRYAEKKVATAAEAQRLVRSIKRRLSAK